MAGAPGAGKTFGGYRVEGEIGRGGMGAVLRATQESLERPVALKKLRRDLAETPELLARFRREARAAAAVHHQNVVTVYDCFQHRNDHYIAQEFVDGLDLRSVLERTGPLPWRIASWIALEVARGLEEIHAIGTVHRDLKPANILLGRRGEVKIADFGIALESEGPALTQPGMVIGSPPYMPPEQLLGERLDARGDIFGFGVVLYEMLAGVPPFALPSEDSEESLLKQMQRERYPGVRRHARETPRAITRLVHGCLRGKARQRVASASRLRLRLERRLGLVSPSDGRARLASWLWEHGVFEARPDETVVLVAKPESAPRPGVRGWLAAALATALLLGGLAIVELNPELQAFTAQRVGAWSGPVPAEPGPLWRPWHP